MGLFGKDDRKPGAFQPTPQQTPKSPSATPHTSGETTLIGRGARFEGTLTGSADMLIEGQFAGAVDATGRLVVAEQGKVEANLHAKVVVIAGSVTGNVSADERIELQPSATLTGNITAPRIQIQEGATFEGEVRMAAPEKKATAGPAEALGKGPESKPAKNGPASANRKGK